MRRRRVLPWKPTILLMSLNCKKRADRLSQICRSSEKAGDSSFLLVGIRIPRNYDESQSVKTEFQLDFPRNWNTISINRLSCLPQLLARAGDRHLRHRGHIQFTNDCVTWFLYCYFTAKGLLRVPGTLCPPPIPPPPMKQAVPRSWSAIGRKECGCNNKDIWRVTRCSWMKLNSWTIRNGIVIHEYNLWISRFCPILIKQFRYIIFAIMFEFIWTVHMLHHTPFIFVDKSFTSKV